MKIDPNLIEVSKCGKYVYPIDSITGARTFAPIEYFKKNVEKKFGGSVAHFVKEYITRDTKKYIKEGYSIEQIKELAAKGKNNKLPKLYVAAKQHPTMPKKERRKRLSSQVESTHVIINAQGEEETVKTYLWSSDPTGYFRSEAKPISVADATRDSCLRPDIYLDSDCNGCPAYTECICELKHKPKKR